MAVPDAEDGVAVAEVGVGTGVLTEALLARPGCRGVVGFELDAEMVRAALRRAALARRGVSVRALPREAAAWSRSDWDAGLPTDAEAPCLLLHGSFLASASVPAACDVAAGNVPYRISAAIVTRLLCQRPPLRRIVLMVQAEFARRLLAQPGSPKYGRVSVLAALLCERRELAFADVIPPSAFTPAPRVDSSVVLLVPRAQELAHAARSKI